MVRVVDPGVTEVGLLSVCVGTNCLRNLYEYIPNFGTLKRYVYHQIL